MIAAASASLLVRAASASVASVIPQHIPGIGIRSPLRLPIVARQLATGTKPQPAPASPTIRFQSMHRAYLWTAQPYARMERTWMTLGDLTDGLRFDTSREQDRNAR